MTNELKSYSKKQKEALLDLAVMLKKLAAEDILKIGREGAAVDGDMVCLLSPGLANLLNLVVEDAKPSRFDEFWSVYPRCRRDAKKAAMAKWKANRLDRFADEIIENVKARVASGQWGEDPKYILLPTTYLNGERWKDVSTGFYGKADEGVYLAKSVPRKPGVHQAKSSLHVAKSPSLAGVNP